jgi:histidinol dehydrogenase
MNGKLRKYVWSELDQAARAAALARPAVMLEATVSVQAEALIAEVRSDGDRALMRLASQFDGAELGTLRVSDDEFKLAEQELDQDLLAAIDVAIANVSRFHAAQLAEPIRVETVSGVVCERVVRPVRAVGLYVPAGSAPLPSTAIMLAVPARLAGCPMRVMCTPARADGRADPAVLAAARRCGVTAIFKAGGAQAIGAMAYGTESIAKVDKIFGPGNAWVTAAKQAVARDAGGAALDMPAGPSEVMVLADAGSDPRFVAFDLLSQAEHGPDSQAVLVTTDPDLLPKVAQEIEHALTTLPRREIIEQSLRHGAAIVVADIAAAMSVVNSYAPEHLIIQLARPRDVIEQIQNAGSVFLGPWTPESVGDYCSGTNHVLPTYGFSRSYSGLGVKDFQKFITLQQLSAGGLQALAPTVRALARHEGLDAHARAVEVRLQSRRAGCAS